MKSDETILLSFNSLNTIFEECIPAGIIYLFIYLFICYLHFDTNLVVHN